MEVSVGEEAVLVDGIEQGALPSQRHLVRLTQTLGIEFVEGNLLVGAFPKHHLNIKQFQDSITHTHLLSKMTSRCHGVVEVVRAHHCRLLAFNIKSSQIFVKTPHLCPRQPGSLRSGQRRCQQWQTDAPGPPCSSCPSSRRQGGAH